MEFREEVVEFIIKTAKTLFGEGDYSADTCFKEDLNCKSADIVRFTTQLEDEYDIEVPYMEFNRKKTFADAADYIAELCGE